MYDFDDNVVRILEITLKNYKNISYGRVKMSDSFDIENKDGNVLGIYGQNGSGKTAIISAIKIIKDIFSGDELPEDINQYIMYGKDEAEVEILFYIKNNIGRYRVRYKIIIFKGNGNGFIKEESIDYWYMSYEDRDWERVKGLIRNRHDKNYIYPKYRNEELLNLYKDKSDFIVDKKMQFMNHKSFIFSEELLKRINKNLDKMNLEYEILNILKHYATSNLFIVDNRELALSHANILLPVNFKDYRDRKNISMGVMPIALDIPSYIPREFMSDIEASLESSNKVISEIIPGLVIKLKELKTQICKTGKEEVLVEVFSCREDIEIPMRYESEGIKKIVAVLHLLIAMFNFNSITIVIDELDSGIFEYLLGEILEILEQRGKGQLIFTSHNLRPLEVLDKNNLVFTTTNVDNRYIKLKNVRPDNNLRDMYYRDLILGGQDETIYDKTNSSKITRAFRKAWE